MYAPAPWEPHPLPRLGAHRRPPPTPLPGDPGPAPPGGREARGERVYIPSEGFGRRQFWLGVESAGLYRGTEYAPRIPPGQARSPSRSSSSSSSSSSSRHDEKCPLFPSYMWERRWPGKNKGVTEQEWIFIEPAWKQTQETMLRHCVHQQSAIGDHYCVPE